jgi:hypothetical protein
MNLLNRLRVLAGMNPLNESKIDHAAYQEALKNKSDDELRHIIKDASEAIKAYPEATKVQNGYYQDEINYCVNELHRRKKEGISKPLINQMQQQDESVNLEDEVVVENDGKEDNIESTEQIVEEVEVIQEEKQEESVPTIEFENKPAFTSDDFEQIVNKFLNDVNSVRDDKQVSRALVYKTPRDVVKACKDRIKEIEQAIALDDEKGYNDQSDKVVAIEVIEHILNNLSTNDQEGYKQAVLYYSSLASNLQHWLPNQLIKYLHQG